MTSREKPTGEYRITNIEVRRKKTKINNVITKARKEDLPQRTWRRERKLF